jgi:hypothetical protein
MQPVDFRATLLIVKFIQVFIPKGVGTCIFKRLSNTYLKIFLITKSKN